MQNDEPVTIIDQPVVVMPGEEDYEQDDELDNDEADNEVPLMPEEDQIPIDNIQVLENYHKTFANGSEEYKYYFIGPFYRFKIANFFPSVFPLDWY